MYLTTDLLWHIQMSCRRRESQTQRSQTLLFWCFRSMIYCYWPRRQLTRIQMPRRRLSLLRRELSPIVFEYSTNLHFFMGRKEMSMRDAMSVIKTTKMRLTFLRSSMIDMSSIAASFRWSIKERVGKRVSWSRFDITQKCRWSLKMKWRIVSSVLFFGVGQIEKAWCWWRWWEKKKRKEYTVAEKEIQFDRRKFWWWTKFQTSVTSTSTRRGRQGLLTEERVAWSFWRRTGGNQWKSRVEREETKNEVWEKSTRMPECLVVLNKWTVKRNLSFLLLYFFPSLDECLVASPLLSNLPGNLLKKLEKLFPSSPLGMNVSNFHCWSSSAWELTRFNDGCSSAVHLDVNRREWLLLLLFLFQKRISNLKYQVARRITHILVDVVSHQWYSLSLTPQEECV